MRLPKTGGGEGRRDFQGAAGNLWGDGYIHYLDYGGGFAGAWMRQKALNLHTFFVNLNKSVILKKTVSKLKIIIKQTLMYFRNPALQVLSSPLGGPPTCDPR